MRKQYTRQKPVKTHAITEEITDLAQPTRLRLNVGGEKVRRHGLSAEQIVKLGILRKRLGLTYRQLSEATANYLSEVNECLHPSVNSVFSVVFIYTRIAENDAK